jgi:hypothetical protein
MNGAPELGRPNSEPLKAGTKSFLIGVEGAETRHSYGYAKKQREVKRRS